MRVLYVHGMGRSPLSGIPLAVQLRRAGIATQGFGYAVTAEDFEAIRARLARRLVAFAEGGPYAVVGHSLGGLLLRAALANLPAHVRRPVHLFLLGSPVRSPRLARAVHTRAWFRALTRSSGQLLASEVGMAAIGPPDVPCTVVLGERGFAVTRRRFAGDPNDGVVAHDEALAPWMRDVVALPLVHSVLPVSARVARVVIDRLQAGTRAEDRETERE